MSLCAQSESGQEKDGGKDCRVGTQEVRVVEQRRQHMRKVHDAKDRTTLCLCGC